MIIISVYKIAQLNFFVKSFFRISGKFFRICSPNRILQLSKRKQGVEHLQQGVGGEPFGQLQPVEQLLPPLRRPRPAGQAQRHQLCLGDGLAFGGGLPRLVQEGGPRPAQRRLQHLGAHTLHPQLALLATPALAALLAVLMLVFFTTMMIGQFIGGAQIFSKAAGVSYGWGLFLFGAVTVFYTAFGGFRAVAVTDTACAVLMLAGMGALGWNILETGGGLEAVMAKVAAAAPRGPGSEGVLLTPASGGALATSLLLSAWVLVGFGTLGLPQSAVRCMSYRRSSDLHQAMIVSTVVCGALMIGMTVLGVFARGGAALRNGRHDGCRDAVPDRELHGSRYGGRDAHRSSGRHDVYGEFPSSCGRLRHHEGSRALSLA